MNDSPQTPWTRIPVGVSACLLGQPVRFDAGHKHDRYVTEVLGQYLEFRPFCPELAVGLGLPRPPIRLIREGERIAVRAVKAAESDWGPALAAEGRGVAASHPELCGFIVKKGSPSCGMERVKLYAENGHSLPGGSVGAFTAALRQAWPELPVEEEGRLHDPALRENFLTRVFVFRRWQELKRNGISAASLLDFHARHKLLIMAHEPEAYRELGRMLANLAAVDLESTASAYLARLMPALTRVATRGRHGNVLQHVLGYFRRRLEPGDRAELSTTIDDYRQGRIPLVVPIRLFSHHLRRTPDPYLARQWYFRPDPDALGLRKLI